MLRIVSYQMICCPKVPRLDRQLKLLAPKYPSIPYVRSVDQKVQHTNYKTTSPGDRQLTRHVWGHTARQQSGKKQSQTPHSKTEWIEQAVAPRHFSRGQNALSHHTAAITHLLPFPLHRDGKQLVCAFQPRHPSRSVVKELLWDQRHEQQDIQHSKNRKATRHRTGKG